MNKINTDNYTLDEILYALVEKLEGDKVSNISTINMSSGISPIKQLKKWEITYAIKERR